MILSRRASDEQRMLVHRITTSTVNLCSDEKGQVSSVAGLGAIDVNLQGGAQVRLLS